MSDERPAPPSVQRRTYPTGDPLVSLCFDQAYDREAWCLWWEAAGQAAFVAWAESCGGEP